MMDRVVSSVWVCSARTELTGGVVQLIRSQADWQVCGLSSELTAAVVAMQEQPGIFLVFIPAAAGHLPPLDHPALSVLRSRTLVVAPSSPSQLLFALRLSAVAMVSASRVMRDLPLALAAVREGTIWCRFEVLPVLTEALEAQGLLSDEIPHLEDLSVRERDVLVLVARGFANREIAERLEISVKTVETYKHRMMLRLHLRTRRDLVALVRRAGWFEGSSDLLGWRPGAIPR